MTTPGRTSHHARLGALRGEAQPYPGRTSVRPGRPDRVFAAYLSFQRLAPRAGDRLSERLRPRGGGILVSAEPAAGQARGVGRAAAAARVGLESDPHPRDRRTAGADR